MQSRWVGATACVLGAALAGASALRQTILRPSAPEREQVSMSKFVMKSVDPPGSRFATTQNARNGGPAPLLSDAATNKAAKLHGARPMREDPMQPLPDSGNGGVQIVTDERTRHRTPRAEPTQNMRATDPAVDREEFWKVRPEKGASAAEVIRKQNPESEQTVFAAPASSPALGAAAKPTEVYVSNQPVGRHEANPPSAPEGNSLQSDRILSVVPLEDARTKTVLSEKIQENRFPSVVPSGNDAMRAAATKATKIEENLQQQEARVRVNGAMASIRTGGRIDPRGRRILNVNIRMRPAVSPPRK
jgi:hypothetical protein